MLDAKVGLCSRKVWFSVNAEHRFAPHAPSPLHFCFFQRLGILHYIFKSSFLFPPILTLSILFLTNCRYTSSSNSNASSCSLRFCLLHILLTSDPRFESRIFDRTSRAFLTVPDPALILLGSSHIFPSMSTASSVCLQIAILHSKNFATLVRYSLSAAYSAC
jgi:hypothetical protein